jgi:pilus assembly protein Flp/PilA
MQDLLLKGYVKMQVLMNTFVQDERGQDLVEYALVVALVAFAAVAGMNTLATKINAAFTSVGSKLDSAMAS